MGLNASADEFCQRTDKTIRSIPWILKIVYVIIINEPDKEILFKHMWSVLRDQVTISEKKPQVED